MKVEASGSASTARRLIEGDAAEDKAWGWKTMSVEEVGVVGGDREPPSRSKSDRSGGSRGSKELDAAAAVVGRRLVALAWEVSREYGEVRSSEY